MNITTQYKTNHNGTGQILAKGGGKQKTVEYDHAHNPDWNHGNAAGELILKVLPYVTPQDAALATHAHVGDGKHVFTI